MSTLTTDSISVLTAYRRVMAGLIILISATFYFFLSLGFEGPAYLQDEIGYLSKAAFFPGIQLMPHPVTMPDTAFFLLRFF